MNRMKELREANGLSKSAVAEAIGITVSAILKYEAGITQPSVYAAWKLARLYGVTIEEMMGYDRMRWDNGQDKS